MLFAVQSGAGALLQIALPGNAGAARGLVRADDDAADAGRVVQRLQCHDQLRGRAVRAGDDSLMLEGVRRIHFGNDQRNLGIHPPIAALIDDDAAALDGPGGKVAGHFVGRAADRQIDAAKGLGRQLFDHVLLAAKGDRGPGRTLRGQELDPLEREVSLFRAARG